jgi:aspartate aminotransferase
MSLEASALNLNFLRDVEKSQTLLLNEQSRLMETKGREVFKFGFGQSPFPPVSSAIEALKNAASRKEYMPVQGLPELRAKIAAFHRDAENLDVSEEQILIAPGSKALLFTAMAAFERANTLIPAPAWVSYAPQANMLGHGVVRVATTYEGRWRITPQALEQAFQSRPDRAAPALLILNYPGNPEGLTYSFEELEALTYVMRKYGILVVSDEIYGLLHHRGTHVPLATLYPEGTITTGGLSKWCGAGGWRLGMAILPKNLTGHFRDVMLGIASETYSCASAPVQIAACAAYTWNDEVKTYLRHQRQLLSALGQWCARHLQNAGLRVHAPEGGFYLFVDGVAIAQGLAQKGINTSQELCTQLMADTGVALLPGEAFGMEPSQLCARLAYVEFDGTAALAIMARLESEHGSEFILDEALLSQIFPKTLRGIQTLGAWAHSFSNRSISTPLDNAA